MSQKYRVTAPDGSKFEITAPEGATEQQALEFARQQFQSQQTPQQQRPSPAVTAPPPEMMARERQAQQQRASEASAYSRARAPGQVFEGEVSVFEAARQAAEAAGVNPGRSAPAEARTALALAAPVAETLPQQADVVRNALGENYEVRVGPDTEKLEYKETGEDQFYLVNPPGFDIRDLAQAAPETATLLAGTAGGGIGLAGGAMTGSPLVAGASTTAGVGIGEGAATKIRLELARDQGYLPELTDDEIVQKSLSRGLEAALWTAGGGVVARGARQLMARQLGASPEVVEALANTPNVDEAFEQARKTQREVAEISGQEFPVTAGQASQSPEMRLAEQRAASQGRGNLGEIERRQQAAQQSVEQTVLGQPITPDEAARVAQSFERKASQDVARLEGNVETAVSPLQAQAGVSPERAAALARGEIVVGRKQLFDENFAPRYQALFENADLRPADLAPLRAAGADIRGTRGQSILPSISLADQRVLKEAEQAGLKVDKGLTLNSNNLLEWRDKLIDEGSNLTQVQNALVDIRRELRRPGIADEAAKASILRELETSLQSIRSRAVGPQKASQLDQLDREYAQAASDYNQSFIDEFTTLRADGTPVVTSETAFNRITRSPEEAASFVDALGRIPTGPEALSQFRRGVISNIIDKGTRQGELSDSALRAYLTPQRRRALKEVFGSEDIANQFDSVSDAVEAVKTRRNQYRAGTQVTDRVLGVSFTSPTKIKDEVYAKLDTLTPQRINTVRNSLPQSEIALFDRALASEIRKDLLDSNGQISPQKIDDFLQSQGSRAAASVFGDVYLSNLGTLRDVARLRQRVTPDTAGRSIDETLAQTFQRTTGGAEGLQKFLRIPFPPLSAKGRALTATLGQLQENGQRQLAEILGDPERFRDLRRLLSTDFYSRNYDKIAARLGLSSLVQFKDIVQGNVVVPETTEENQQPARIPITRDSSDFEGQ